MKLKVEYGNGVIVLPGKVAELIPKASQSELSVLIYLLSDDRLKGDIDIPSIASDLELDESAVNAAVGYWRGAGILTDIGHEGSAVTVKQSKGKDKGNIITVISGDMPHYTGEEIERLFASEPKLGTFIDGCQQTLGRIFTPHEINKMLALREYYGLECEYILRLCAYCKENDKGSVPYVEKTAKGFINSGVTSLAALEEKLAYLKRFNTTEAIVRRICGLGSRALTAKEKRFIDRWTELDIPGDMLEIAYEVTVNNTSSPSMPYMNQVIANWVNAGYKSSEEVFAGMEDYRKKKEKEAKEKEGGSFDTDEFFETAVRRSLERHLQKEASANS